MKFLVIVLLFINLLAFGQSDRYTVGFHFNAGLSNLTEKYTFYLPSKSQRTPILATGLDFRRQMGQNGFYLQSGIRLNGYGWRNEITSILWNGTTFDETINDYSTNLSLLTVPLIFTYKLNKIIPGLTVSAGPQLSFISFRKWRKNGKVISSQWNEIELQTSAFLSVGYEYEITDAWIVGGAIESNMILPWELYNFGAGVSARYILKSID